MQKPGSRIYLAVVMAMVFWSLTFIWYKDVFEFYKPLTLVVLRLSISSLVLFAVTAIIGKLVKVNRADIKYFMLLAFFEPFMYFVGETYGMTMISSTLAAVIISIIPLFSPIGEYYFYKQRITPMNFLGIVVSVVGVCVVIFHKGFGQVDANPYGVLLMLLAVFSGLGYSLTLRKLTSKYNVFSIITYQNTLGALYFLPLFLIFEVDHFIGVGISIKSMIPIFELAIFGSTIAFLLFTYSVKHLGVTSANSFTNAIPVLTAIFAYFMNGEVITPLKMAGIAVVVLGLFLSQVPKKRMQKVFAFIPVGLITKARLNKE
ncbi:MAG: DMT family transporter [Bacteroidales bacterium]|nr:DMT family transporter [Bacteroidales bacterium]